jgi:hypothetical protein
MLKLATILALSLLALAPQQPDPTPASSSAALVTKTGVIPLTHTATVALIDNRFLNLEPGIQMTRDNDRFALSTFDGKNVEISAGSDTFALASPVSARLSNAGWDFGNGRTYPAASVTARRKQQDDADSNLKSMQESARKIKKNAPKDLDPNAPARKLRVRWLYGENAMVTSELFNSEAILPLGHISPFGW